MRRHCIKTFATSWAPVEHPTSYFVRTIGRDRILKDRVVNFAGEVLGRRRHPAAMDHPSLRSPAKNILSRQADFSMLVASIRACALPALYILAWDDFISSPVRLGVFEVIAIITVRWTGVFMFASPRLTTVRVTRRRTFSIAWSPNSSKLSWPANVSESVWCRALLNESYGPSWTAECSRAASCACCAKNEPRLDRTCDSKSILMKILSRISGNFALFGLGSAILPGSPRETPFSRCSQEIRTQREVSWASWRAAVLKRLQVMNEAIRSLPTVSGHV